MSRAGDRIPMNRRRGGVHVPRVSVGLPVFNGEPYLEETLASLRCQTLDDLEIVISDNASTDGTEELCRAAARADARIRYVREPENRGAAWNYNRVLELARAPYFKWAAADDVCRPEFLSACLEVLEHAPPTVVLAFPQTVLVDSAGKVLTELDDSDLDLRQPTPHERVAQLLRNRFEWHPVFGLIRTDVLRQTIGIGGFVLADVVTLTELALRGEFHQVPRRLFVRRYHDARSVIANAEPTAQASWFDPANRGQVVLPQVRVASELYKAVGRAPLPLPEQLRCAGAATRSWILPHWRHMGGEVKRAIRQFAQRRRDAVGSVTARG